MQGDRPVALSLLEVVVTVLIIAASALAVLQARSWHGRASEAAADSIALQEGLPAASWLQVEIANAGFNLASSALPDESAADVSCVTALDGRELAMTPLSIAPGAQPSDDLVTMSGSNSQVPRALPLASSLPAGAREVTLADSWGLSQGDWVLLRERAGFSQGSRGAARCTLGRIQAIQRSAASASISPSASATLRLNVAVIDDLQSPVLVDLGASPNLQRIRVIQDRLQAEDLLAPQEPARVIAENVVAMRLQLGLGDERAPAVQRWVGTDSSPDARPARASPATERPDQAVRAVRFALLVRGDPIRNALCDDGHERTLELLPAVSGVSRVDEQLNTPSIPAIRIDRPRQLQDCVRNQTLVGLVRLRNQAPRS